MFPELGPLQQEHLILHVLPGVGVNVPLQQTDELFNCAEIRHALLHPTLNQAWTKYDNQQAINEQATGWWILQSWIFHAPPLPHLESVKY